MYNVFFIFILRSISDRFNVTKSTVFQYLVRISNILNELAADVIKWPDENRAHTIIEEFLVSIAEVLLQN